MRTIWFSAVMALSVGLSAQAFAQASLNGTWKIDEAATKLPDKPSIWMLKDGKFSCESCTPKYSIVADGAFHPIAGNPYIDETAVTIASANAAKFQYRKAGKVTGEQTRTVSSDGQMITNKGVDLSTPSGVPINYTDSYKRIAPGEEGSHALAGSWKRDKEETAEAAALTFMFDLKGDDLVYTTPTGERLVAKIGGPAAPWEKDPAGAMAIVTRSGPNGIRITTAVKNEILGYVDMATSEDGKTLNVTAHSMRQKTDTKYVARKL